MEVLKTDAQHVSLCGELLLLLLDKVALLADLSGLFNGALGHHVYASLIREPWPLENAHTSYALFGPHPRLLSFCGLLLAAFLFVIT